MWIGLVCGVMQTFQCPRQETCSLTTPGVLTTGSCPAHAGRFKFSKIQILALNFIMGDKIVSLLLPFVPFQGNAVKYESLSNHSLFAFCPFSKNDVPEKSG